MSEMTDLVQADMLSGFRNLSEQEQKEIVMLGGNVKFLIRMLGSFDMSTETGKIVKTILATLTRGIPSLGGEDL